MKDSTTGRANAKGKAKRSRVTKNMIVSTRFGRNETKNFKVIFT